MFGTSGIRGRIGEEVTAATALSVGRALAADGYDRVVVGRDPRDSGRMLRKAVVAGLEEGGSDVVDLGMAATPTVARSVGRHAADAGVAITASHNPAPDNGLKLWTPTGQAFDTERRERIADRVREADFAFAAWDGIGETTTDDRADRAHIEAIRASVGGPLDCSVVVDSGTGAGGVSADALTALGCDVQTLNARPDGSFPARPSEPTADHCDVLRATVANTDADLGIAHDGDADRMLAVDETGRFVSGDVLLALLAQRSVEAGDSVAAPVDTSLAVDDALAPMDVTVTRTRVGDVFVAEAATAEDVTFGGEPSGAWIWPAETLCPDGPLAAAKLAALVDDEGALSALVDGIDTYPIRRENVESDDNGAVLARVETLVRERYDADRIETLDGVRVSFPDGWILVRASGTQPLVRLTAEARSEERTTELLSEARALVSTASEN
ncbi:phosphoglucosamine mutase [Halobaculum gomorrense]|uniref:Phosphoglucosamine mutase n=1 Tax=Halobaculum gomorrense TaxID=43928 RepID=A0A1M5JCT3_9EURY|nr:phosphoglucosamine mutase [Halobaculum gomorrense]SHG38185.1 phosphoglucosamine mutase [Halobaculum gomorrense]